MNDVAARLPRFERKPHAIPAFEITKRVEDILLIVARHRVVRSSHVVDLLAAAEPSTSAQKVIRCLGLLFHAGYLSRPSAQLDAYRAGAGSRPMVYMLGNHGIDILAAKFGFKRSSVDWSTKARTSSRGDIVHALEVTDFMVAMALACKRRGMVELIYFDEIMRELAPPATRAHPRPYHWPVTVEHRGQETELYIIPDKTFGIRDLNRKSGRDRSFFFLESDRGSMPVMRSNLAQSSLGRKLIGYAHTFRADHHKLIYGLPNMRVLIVTTSRQRINSIITAHRQHTAALVSPRLFLMADRKALLGANDFFAHPWLDAAGVERRLLD